MNRQVDVLITAHRVQPDRQDPVHAVRIVWKDEDGDHSAVHRLTRYVPYFPGLLLPAGPSGRRQQIIAHAMKAEADEPGSGALAAAALTIAMLRLPPQPDPEGFLPLPVPIRARMLLRETGTRLLIFDP